MLLLVVLLIGIVEITFFAILAPLGLLNNEVVLTMKATDRPTLNVSEVIIKH